MYPLFVDGSVGKNNLRKFGLTMGIAFLAIAALILLRHRHDPGVFFIVSFILFTFGLIYPLFLKPVYIFWMGLAHLLGWVNTRLLLIVMFYLIFSPVGLILRLLRIDLLDRAIDKGKNTYWRKKEESADYNRQF